MPVSPHSMIEIKRPLPLVAMGVRVLFRQVQAGHWAEQLRSMAGGSKTVTGNVVHPCFINHQATLVHAADLATRNPEFFHDLQRFAAEQGYVLFADRRNKDLSVAQDRRSNLLPVVVFSLGVGSAAMAAEPSPAAQQTLALFDSGLERVEEDALSHQDEIENFTPAQQVDVVDDAVFHELETILQSHYVSGGDEPEYVRNDLQQMARYFAHYPEAAALIRSLKDKAWQLSFAEDTFATEVRGNALQVHSVNVRFDPRAAAQLRRHKACDDNPGACVASPADALLHELLHAASALLDPQRFIAQGGINSVIYPFEHESEVIRSENLLYRAMTAVDGRYRPHRHRHAGQVVASACVTCLNE